MWYIKRTPPWYVDRDVSIRNSLRSNYTIRVLVVIETRHVSDTYVEVSVGAQALFLPIRRRLKKEKREKRTCSLQKYLVPGAVHASTQQTR